METTIVYWTCMGIMEKNMKTPIKGILGLYEENGEEHGNSYICFLKK